MYSRRGLQKFPLPFAPWPVVTACHHEREVLGRQAPFMPLHFARRWAEAVRINATMDYADFRMVPLQRRAGVTFRFLRFWFIHTLAQNFGYELGDGNDRVALSQQKPAAEQ